MEVAPWWWEIVDLLVYISLDQEAETGLEIRLVINPKSIPFPRPTVSQNATTSWEPSFKMEVCGGHFTPTLYVPKLR